jgi:iduronate 2-sulfatase
VPKHNIHPIIFLAPILFAGIFFSNAVAQDDQPNVLFIAIDDLRPELGCYGVETIQTPRMDELAGQGVLFNRAYCQLAVCNPSRVSLLTGLRPDTNRVWDLVTEFRDTIPDAVTLPQQFSRNGYYTVGMGKIFHNSFPDPKSWTVPQQPRPAPTSSYSSDVREELARQRAEARANGMTAREIGNRIRGPATDVEDVPDNARVDGALTDLAIEQLRLASDQKDPFFVAVGYILPHLPWTPPKKYWDIYDPAEIPMAENDFLPQDMPPVAFGDRSFGGMYELRDCMDFRDAPSPFEGSLTEAERRRLKHGYYASVSFIDAQVGRLLDELDRLELREDTIIVLWGDHGWKLGEHNGWCKQTNFEIDTRVPMLIAAPGAEANGSTSDALVEFVDIYSTLCDLAGIPTPDELEGDSLTPLLEDASASVKDAAFSQFSRKHEGVQHMGYAARTDRWRYVEWVRLDTAETVAVELYDHANDAAENVNVAVKPEFESVIRTHQEILWAGFTRPNPGTVLRTPKPETTQAAPQTRPVLHIENPRDEAVVIYWIDDQGERRRVGFISPHGSQTQNSTQGHQFVFEGVRDEYSEEFTIRQQEETLILNADERPPQNANRSTDEVQYETPSSTEVTAPPEAWGVDPFYTKCVSVDGFPIVASAAVNDYALKEAAYLVGMLMAERPDVLDAMAASGSRLCIIGYDEYTTDLPEFAHFRPKDYWDARARGTGGSRTDPYCSCGEENLLCLQGDPYTQENILIHELAHNIHLRGLVNVDSTFDDRLESAYDDAMKQGLWAGKYAAMNHHEYFAEGVQSWFDNNRKPDHDHNHVDTRAELIEYDPALADICREVFGDTELVYTKPTTRLEGHMAGYDPSAAPRFAWPERLDEARAEIRSGINQRLEEQAEEEASE